MRRTVWLALITAAALGGCTQATPELQIINDAAQALGGRDRIHAVRTLTIEGTGINGNLGQDMTPDATSQAFDLTGYRRVVDVSGGRARIEQTRTPNFTYFQGQQPQKQVLGIDGDVGYNVAPDGTASRVPEAAASDRRSHAGRLSAGGTLSDNAAVRRGAARGRFPRNRDAADLRRLHPAPELRIPDRGRHCRRRHRALPPRRGRRRSCRWRPER